MSGSDLKRTMDDEARPIVVTLAAGLAMLYGVVAFGAAIAALIVAYADKAFEDSFFQPILSIDTIGIFSPTVIFFLFFVIFAVVAGVSVGIFLAGLAAWRRKRWARWPLIVAYFVGGAVFALGSSEIMLAAVMNVAAAVGLLTKAAARWYESA
jgi:hypothetical protein